MRLMVLGDTAGTGFGTVTSDLGRSLIGLGVDCRFVSLNEQPLGELSEPFVGRTAEIGGPRGWLARPPMPVRPEDDDEEAKAEFDAAMAKWSAFQGRIHSWATGGLFEDGWPPEAAVIIGDVASLKMSPFLNFIPEGFPVYHYVPIEGVGLPPIWRTIWSGIKPIAMSEFGADQIEGIGIPRPPVVYHGVDTSAFFQVSGNRPIDVYQGESATPRSHEVGRQLRIRAMKEGRRPGVAEGILSSKADCKTFIGMKPDRILLYRADRHVPRKNYASLLRALAPVLAKHPDVDFLYHCRTIDQAGDLDDERSKYGPLVGWEPCKHPEKCVRGGMHPMFGGVANRMVSTGLHDHFGGADRRMLNVLYNAADIYVSCSAEGFGLTIAEAMACGVPPVGMEYSSVPEVIGDAGILVPLQGLTDNIYSHFWALVNEGAFSTAVESLVTSRKARRDYGSRGPGRVENLFSWDGAARAMLAVIEAREAIAA